MRESKREMLASSYRETHFSVIRVKGVRSAQFSVWVSVHKDIKSQKKYKGSECLTKDKNNIYKARNTG